MNVVSRALAVILFGTSFAFPDSNGDFAKNTAQTLDTNSTNPDYIAATLDSVSITANRIETDISKYVGQIGVLNSSSLQESTRLVEALGQIPGVSFGDDFGRQAGQQFRVRGFGYQSEDRVIIEQDGIKRSPSLYSNQISTFRTDSDLLKRVEVVKGASSVLHGSGAIGGIVSMQTKGVGDFVKSGERHGFMLGHRHESNHMNSNRAAVAFKPAENLGILLYGKRADHGNSKLADGGRVNGNSKVTHVKSDERINTLFGKIEWDISDAHELDFSLYNFRENLHTGWQSLWWDEPGAAPTIGTIRQRDFNSLYKYSPVENPYINFQARYYHTTASYARNRKGQVGKNFVDIDYTNKDRRWGLDLKNESFFNTGAFEHRVVVGAEHENRRQDFSFVSKGKHEDPSSHPATYKDYGFYIQDVIGIGDFEITMGGRYDYFRRGVEKPNRPEYSEGRFSPKFALAYEVFDGINLLAGYAETFRAPTPHETSSAGPINPRYYYVPNTSLTPEIAREYEVGFSVDRELFGNDNLWLKSTYYNGSIEDMITLSARPELGTPPSPDGVTTRQYGSYTNISEAKRYGYELEARYGIGNTSFNLGYDHMKLYDKKTRKRIQPYADKLTLGASYYIEPWRLNVGADLTHWFTPERDVKVVKSGSKTYEYVDESFTITNLRALWVPRRIWHFSDGAKVGFGVKNIFDKPYIHAENYKTSTSVGRGRNFYVDFELKF